MKIQKNITPGQTDSTEYFFSSKLVLVSVACQKTKSKIYSSMVTRHEAPPPTSAINGLWRRYGACVLGEPWLELLAKRVRLCLKLF